MTGLNLGGIASVEELVIGPAFSVYNVLDADPDDDWEDIWIVDPGAASLAVTQLTDNEGLLQYDAQPLVSPNGRYVLFVREIAGGGTDSQLWVCDSDGLNPTQLTAYIVQNPQWITNNLILYADSSGQLATINRDGSGATTIVPVSTQWSNVSPDGQLIAYTLQGPPPELWTIEPDGSNDTKIIADMGTFATLPVFRTDSSRILYADDSAAQDWITVLTDGTSPVVESATPDGYWWHTGMFSDRFFYIDTSNFSQWKLANLVFGSGLSLVSPTLYADLHTGRAVPRDGQGRIFTVQNGSLMGGVDSVVSVLPDGSDLRRHFDPSDSAPVFQSCAFED